MGRVEVGESSSKLLQLAGAAGHTFDCSAQRKQ